MLEAIQKIIEQQIAPTLEEHGGGIELLDYKDGTLRIRLLGQCCNCPASQATVNDLILTTLQEQLPGIDVIELAESETAMELLDIARAILRGKVQ